MNLQKLTGKDLAKAEDTKKKMRSLLQQVRSRLQKLQRTDDDEAYAKSSVNVSSPSSQHWYHLIGR